MDEKFNENEKHEFIELFENFRENTVSDYIWFLENVIEDCENNCHDEECIFYNDYEKSCYLKELLYKVDDVERKYIEIKKILDATNEEDN